MSRHSYFPAKTVTELLVLAGIVAKQSGDILPPSSLARSSEDVIPHALTQFFGTCAYILSIMFTYIYYMTIYLTTKDFHIINLCSKQKYFYQYSFKRCIYNKRQGMLVCTS